MIESILQKGAALIAGSQKRSCGQAITFRRGDSIAAELVAVVGEKLFRYTGSDGADVVTKTRDFIVDTDELLKVGIDEPRRGDVISQINRDYVPIEYEVAAPNDEPVFSYVDERQTRIRIHTTDTGPEATE